MPSSPRLFLLSVLSATVWLGLASTVNASETLSEASSTLASSDAKTDLKSDSNLTSSANTVEAINSIEDSANGSSIRHVISQRLKQEKPEKPISFLATKSEIESETQLQKFCQFEHFSSLDLKLEEALSLKAENCPNFQDLKDRLIVEPEDASSESNAALSEIFISSENENASDSQDLKKESEVPQSRLSREINLLTIRALRKPVTNKVLDTGLFIQGIRQREEDNSRFLQRSFMTGDWGGLRDTLDEHGIDLIYAYYNEIYGNPLGGIKQGFSVNQVHILSGDLYTDRVGWWDGGMIHITGSWLTGDSVARERVGSLNSVYFGDPPESGPRLFELFYGQDLFNQKLNIRVGKIYPFVKIAASQTAGLFTNTSFTYPTFLGSSPSSGFSAGYGAAPWGIQVAYNPNRNWNFIAHIMDGFDDPSGGFKNRDGLKSDLNGKDGAEGIFETLYRLNQNPGDTRLPGYYRAGAQFHTGTFNELKTLVQTDSSGNSGGGPRQQRGNSAFYVTAEQMVYRESADPTDRTQGLNLFAKAVVSPKQDINLVSMNVSGGLAYEGPIPGRDRDVLGLGVSHTRFSNGTRALDRQINRLGGDNAIRDAETVVELTYAAEIARWWLVVGSAQYIINPGGYSDRNNATVLGVSNRFSF